MLLKTAALLLVMLVLQSCCAPCNSPEPETASTASMTGTQDIIDTAVGAGSFKTLVTAVKATGLVETLKGEGPFTVFAPNDEAFAAIPEADLNALLADRDKLAAILTYHVVPGRVLSTDLKVTPEPFQVASVQGANLDVQKSDAGAVSVNDASVIQADLIVSNGVIHVIDRVILPPRAGTP